ncbi:MAG: urease accessory protein UreF [Rhodobacterales bacterium]|nr:urease accessory protein UreF [Rhodobacterales bacterium]
MTALLTLVQWLSPAFPTGGFAYSSGLEWAIAAGTVRDAAGLQDWLGHLLDRGSAQADAVLLCAALRPGADLDALDARARALAASRERLVETLDQGRALAQTTNALTGADHPPRALPVALGAAAPLGLGVDQVAQLFLQAWAANLVQAAVRFVPLGQTAGQAVLAALQPAIVAAAARAAATAPEEIATAAHAADLAAMRHETMDVRIFRT